MRQACLPRGVKGDPQPLRLPFHELLRMIQSVLSLPGVSLCADQGVPHPRRIHIFIIIVLQKQELLSECSLQLSRLLRVPEHIMVAPEHDLPSRERQHIVKIRSCLLQGFCPGQVPQNHHGILRRDLPHPVSANPRLVVHPGAPEPVHRFLPAIGEVQVADCV